MQTVSTVTFKASCAPSMRTIATAYKRFEWFNFFAQWTLFLGIIVRFISIFTREMLSLVFCFRHYYKIFNPVISFIFVNMMNNFRRKKFSTEMLFHDVAVFFHKNAVASYILIFIHVAFIAKAGINV